MSYIVRTKASWAQTQNELEELFAKWGVEEWTTNYPKGARSVAWSQSIPDRTVTITFVKNGKTVNLSMDKQQRAIDNLRVIYLALEAMRMNEKRGLTEVLQSAYMQLDAPKTKRDPYEVLGTVHGVSLEVAEAVYRTMARKYHPDSIPSGDLDKFKELNEAIEEIRKEKNG